MIMSTGMNTIESISKSVAIMEEAGVPYALLHTTNIYPTPPHLVRLGAMSELIEEGFISEDHIITYSNNCLDMPKFRKERLIHYYENFSKYFSVDD